MYHSSTQRRQQLQNWQKVLSLSFLWCCHPQREHLKLFQWDNIRPQSLKLKQAAEACGVLPLMYVLLCHIWDIITGYPSIMEMESIWDIHAYLESMITKRSNHKKFSSEISREFPKKKCWNWSIIYKCNLKIVKICQKGANFESGSLCEKLLRIEKSSSKSYKLLESYRAESV